MNIKAKIEKMEQIAQEIEKELAFVKLYFTWHITMQSSEHDRAALGVNVQFHHLREELYGELAKAGVLPRKDGPAAETAPSQG